MAEAKINESNLSAMMMDIDHFKKINDKYGHERGNRVLIGISRSCADMLSDHDEMGRFGGEEFAVLLPGVDLVTAVGIAERMRKKVEKMSFNLNEQNVGVTISIGVAQLAGPGMTLEGLLDRADRALYRAKELGRNRVETFSG